MKKISRRSFIESAAIGSGLIGGALLSGSPSSLAKVGALLNNPEESAKDQALPLQANADASRFFHWSFGEELYGSQWSAQSGNFRYWFTPSIENKFYSLREQVLHTCQVLDTERAGKTVALCMSGGVDSEIIALAMQQVGVPFEMYFLDNWGLNYDTYKTFVKPFAAKIGKDVKVVALSKKYFVYEHMLPAFHDLGCENPTYLTMTHLFNVIPSNQFIVVGDGDLDRDGDLFSFIGKNNPVAEALPNGAQPKYVPFSTTSVAYRLWAQKHGRKGEFYFFSSNPAILAATINHPLSQMNYPMSRTKAVIAAEFPEVNVRSKTTNWDSGSARRENDLIRRDIRFYALRQKLNYWKPANGVAVDVSQLFYPA